MKVFILLSVLICVSYADVKAPYSYPKPQGARLELPVQYGSPFRAPENLNLVATTEITTTENYETTTFNRNYLPPGSTSIPEEELDSSFSGQEPPAPSPPLTFTSHIGVQPTQERVQPPQNARFSELEDFKTQFFASQYQLQFAPRNGRLEQAPSVQNHLVPNYGPPQQDAKDTEEVDPDQELSRDNSKEEQDQPVTEKTNESSEEEESDAEDSDEPTIAIANAVHMGQYYILAPDNTLQKVQFQTLQTEDDLRSHGFTAQLRYTPIEPIKPPVYGYNEKGLLVRLFRK